MKSIKAVLIDVDDTLIDFEKCARYGIYKSAEELGLSLPVNTFEIFKDINDELWRRFEKGELDRQTVLDSRWNKVFAITGTRCEGSLFEEYFIDHLEASHFHVRGALPLLRYLSEKYYLCIASNAPRALQLNRLENAGMLSYFNDIFLSGAIGLNKPTPEYFAYCLDNMNLKPEEVCMLGDSLTADIGGAKKSGLMTIWFNKYKDESRPELYDHEVKRLCDVRKFL